jgi:transaldolase
MSTQEFHDLGQSLWLDNITRDLLKSGTLRRYIDEWSVTGLTSNPTIFDHAIKNSGSYDAAIEAGLSRGTTGEDLFFELALGDLVEAANLLRPIHEKTAGVDGWVSLEVSPLIAHDTNATIAEAKRLHQSAQCSNLMIKIPGTKEGLPAIEESICAGIPINVTLLFSAEQYAAAADAFMRGIKRRIETGLKPDVASVASIFVSRWDVAIAEKVPAALQNKLGIAVAVEVYEAYLAHLRSPGWMRAYNAGARPQRLLWASTGTKDPKARDVLYIETLAAPFTVNTMPEPTLKALANHGVIGVALEQTARDNKKLLAQFADAGVDLNALGAQLQDEGARSFIDSWKDLMGVIASKSATFEQKSRRHGS